MYRAHWVTVLCLVLTLTACVGSAASTTTMVEGATAKASSAIAPTPFVVTASISTVMPETSLPPDQVTPFIYDPPTATLIPPLPGGLGPTELKYRVLAQFPDFFFCDPDYYPIARVDEMDLARHRFPDILANQEEFETILAHNALSGQTDFSDDQKLLIYRDHKKLAAIYFELVTTGYQFQIQSAKSEGSGEVINGVIDAQGTITIQQRQPSFATCPICLAYDTLIDTPDGPVSVQSLRIGMQVWTVNDTGQRVAQPVIRLSKTVVPATHQVVHLVLSDGRELWVSPGHPTTDGRTVGHLKVGEPLDGAVIVSVERVPYDGAATYDLLPAGDTGFYWANGILMASTLEKTTSE
jgi:Hint domain-containing protein